MKFVFVFAADSDNQAVEVNDVGMVQETDPASEFENVFLIRLNEYIAISKRLLMDFNIKQVGDNHDRKVCDRCFKLLDTADRFSNNRLKKDNQITKRPSCKSCRSTKDGRPVKKIDRDKWELGKPSDYTLFKCPICNKTTIAGISRIVLDHNHHTGGVRGWICESCNTGIGRFDDNLEQIQRAMDWLGTN